MAAPSNTLLLEKIENLGNALKALRKENFHDHGEIITHQKETNGNVRLLQLWKAEVSGMFKGIKTTGQAVKTGWLALAGIIGWMAHFLF